MGNMPAWLLVQDLIIDTEWTCIEYENFQYKCIYRKVRHEALIEKLKDELFRVMLMQKEEKCLEVDSAKKKIDNEWKLDAKEEIHEEESDDEYDSE